MSSQLYGYIPYDNRPAGKKQQQWWPLKAELQADGTCILKIDSELELDAGNVYITNIKVGSVDQTKTNVRFLKVLDDGTLIAVSDPTKLYKATDVDDSGAVKYYGHTDVDGEWYILEEDTSGAVATYRYVKGSSDYTTNWTNRALLTYDYYYNVF